MHLSIFNGSPRKKNSNTEILLNSFIKGFCHDVDNTATTYYLMEKSKRQEHLEAFDKSDIIIIAMPLYCFAMPSIVKDFIEAIPAETRNPQRKLGFIIQSGFEESCHSEILKSYFDTLPCFIPCDYLGTIIKGGVEGIKIKPPFMVKKITTPFFHLGEELAKSKTFDPQIVKKLATPYVYSKFTVFMMTLFLAKIADSFWNKQLKENGAYDKRFAKPYAS